MSNFRVPGARSGLSDVNELEKDSYLKLAASTLGWTAATATVGLVPPVNWASVVEMGRQFRRPGEAAGLTPFPLVGYRTFSVSVAPAGTDLLVTAVGPDGGTAEETVTLPVCWERALARSGIVSRQLSGVAGVPHLPWPNGLDHLGDKVGDCLLFQSVRDLYRECLKTARDRNQGLRLQLSVAAGCIEYPWEVARHRGAFLGVDIWTPITRGPVASQSLKPLAVTGPLKILLMISQPKGVPALNVADEHDGLREALRTQITAGAVSIKRLTRKVGQSQLDALRRELMNGYHVLHYIGHGQFNRAGKMGELCFEGTDDKVALIPPYMLMPNLQNSPDLRLIFLNGCETGAGHGAGCLADRLVVAGVPAVIGMRREVDDGAASRLAAAFYDAIGRNWPVEAALTTARLSVWNDSPNRGDWADPMLFSHMTDGRLFEVT